MITGPSGQNPSDATRTSSLLSWGVIEIRASFLEAINIYPTIENIYGEKNPHNLTLDSQVRTSDQLAALLLGSFILSRAQLNPREYRRTRTVTASRSKVLYGSTLSKLPVTLRVSTVRSVKEELIQNMP